MSERRMSAKFSGRCIVCAKHIARGAWISWSRERGARHDACPIGATIDKATGKTYYELAKEWDKEHENDACSVERFEAMRQNADYRDVPEDAIWDYAWQDTPKNPYR